jgi:hypothetical protein
VHIKIFLSKNSTLLKGNFGCHSSQKCYMFYVQRYWIKRNYEQTKLCQFLEKTSPETSSIIYPVKNKYIWSVNTLPNIHGEALPEKCIDAYQKISI